MGSSITRRILCIAAIALSMLVLGLVAMWGGYLTQSTDRVFVPASRAEASALNGSGAASPLSLPPLLSGIGGPPPLSIVPIPIGDPAQATIQVSPGTTTTVAIPGSMGNVSIPNEVASSTPMRVTVQPVSLSRVVPPGLTVLKALQITFTSLTDSSTVSSLSEDVTIEISYAGLGLTESQLNNLVIYNSTRDEFLVTTLDRTRQVAIAKAHLFSTFTLAQIVASPRAYVPFAVREYSGGW